MTNLQTSLYGYPGKAYMTRRPVQDEMNGEVE